MSRALKSVRQLGEQFAPPTLRPLQDEAEVALECSGASWNCLVCAQTLQCARGQFIMLRLDICTNAYRCEYCVP